ncbi:4Fe-4S binding protein [Eubacteriaceae bacterium ES3]|nr:4Fe-4S binding protein [Eubacteriaceae bacterium ES3]
MAHSISEACIGCGACKTKCPVNAIDGEKKEIHRINQIRCVDCGVCGKVCPKNAVSDQNNQILKKVAKQDWKKPLIQKNSCSACSMCVDICSFDCLAISKPQFTGDIDVFACLEDEKKCVGCGMCEDICPLQAITMTGGASV